jgi:chromosome segregation ATPase
MKTKSVTFALVAKEIDRLNLAGEKITVRNVLARTGGSAGTISEFIKRWQNQQRSMRAYSISDDMVSAFITEVEGAINEALKVKERELIDTNLLNDELKAVNNDLEAKLLDYSETKQQLLSNKERCAILEQELHSVRKSYDEMVGKFAVLNQNLEDVKVKLSKVEKLLPQVEREKNNALKELAVYRAKAEQLQEQLDKLFSQLKINNKI